MISHGQDGSRTEHDSFGDIEVAADALWGAQTERARRNFQLSGTRLPAAFISAVATIKAAAARANAQLRATPAAPTATPAETTAAAAPAAGTQHAAATPAATTAAATPPPAPAPAPAAPAGETRSAELVKSAAPEYPREAFIKHTEGWVEVEFTVTPEGTVTNATVASAQPARVFNEAALRAVQRWTFKPRLDNGKPTEERMKRRIEFKLGAG